MRGETRRKCRAAQSERHHKQEGQSFAERSLSPLSSPSRPLPVRRRRACIDLCVGALPLLPLRCLHPTRIVPSTPTVIPLAPSIPTVAPAGLCPSPRANPTDSAGVHALCIHGASTIGTGITRQQLRAALFIIPYTRLCARERPIRRRNILGIERLCRIMRSAHD